MHKRVVLSLAALVLVLAACSSGKKTVTTSDGTTITTSTDNKTATIQTKDSTATYGAGAIDPAKLGAPVYPAASKTEGGMTMQGTSGGSTVAAFSTRDSFDTVYGWYKNHMPAGSEKMKMSAGGQDNAEFVVGPPDKDQTAVMITSKDAGKTEIVITHTTKK